jgi:hypothetical protein
MAVRTYPVLPLKSMTFLRQRRPRGVVVSPGKDHHRGVVGECAGGVIPAGRNDPELLQELFGGPDGQDVVAQRVERAVVAEPVVEVHRENRQIGRRRTTGMIGDEQGATRGYAAQILYFRAEVPLDDRSQHADHPFGQVRIPLCDLRNLLIRPVFDMLKCWHVAPC